MDRGVPGRPFTRGARARASDAHDLLRKVLPPLRFWVLWSSRGSHGGLGGTCTAVEACVAKLLRMRRWVGGGAPLEIARSSARLPIFLGGGWATARDTTT